MTLPALYIGRFQPFHLGHLDAIHQILARESSLIIAIGSAQYDGTETNPYTYELRKEIIEASLAEAKIPLGKFTIAPLPDIHDDTAWCDYIDKTLPSYRNVYTGSAKVKRLFDAHGKHHVITLDLRLPISSTEIRRKIASGEKWQDLVPQACYEILSSGTSWSRQYAMRY